MTPLVKKNLTSINHVTTRYGVKLKWRVHRENHVWYVRHGCTTGSSEVHSWRMKCVTVIPIGLELSENILNTYFTKFLLKQHSKEDWTLIRHRPITKVNKFSYSILFLHCTCKINCLFLIMFMKNNVLTVCALWVQE